MADKFRRKKEPLHVRLYHSIMATPAWKAASGNSIKVLLALIRKDNGSRNGQIAFSCREAAELTGLSVRTCQRCLKELEELGFIRCTEKGAFNRKVLHASLWRYTWQAWPEGKKGPTREFEKWQPDGNSRMQVSHSPDANLSKVGKTDPATVEDIATDQIGNSLVSADPYSDRIATLTSYQGDATAQPDCQQWKQANSTSDPFCAELRDSLIDLLEVSEPGIQSRLAKLSGIPAGTLSKFKNGASLPIHHAAALQRALQEAA